ncbi:hypothetical protein BGP_1100 [Beggiatoa sp. PS]|nr:hypothetical protein BGP_1100 [Beggiatoa sp. PS]
MTAPHCIKLRNHPFNLWEIPSKQIKERWVEDFSKTISKIFQDKSICKISLANSSLFIEKRSWGKSFHITY